MADYQKHIEQFKAIDTRVVALSVDSESDAHKMVDNNELTFPVLYDLDGIKTLETIGGYINEKPPYLHPSGFILRPDGTIVQLVQSSGPIGRLVASDTIAVLRHYQNP